MSEFHSSQSPTWTPMQGSPKLIPEHSTWDLGLERVSSRLSENDPFALKMEGLNRKASEMSNYSFGLFEGTTDSANNGEFGLRCPRCHSSMAPQQIHEKIYLFLCANTDCLYPIDQPELPVFLCENVSSAVEAIEELKRRQHSKGS